MPPSTTNSKQYPTAGEMGKENVLLLSNVIAMRLWLFQTATGFACGTLPVTVRQICKIMTTAIKQFSDRINQLIGLANRTLATKQTSSGSFSTSFVNSELFFEFRTSSLSFILNLYGDRHPFYTDFNERVARADPYDTGEGRGILNSIKTEIDNGWLTSLKGLVSAEIFSDFLEMADHLLKENYKDPAAVMIGSVLEEHLRQLCIKHGIPTDDPKSGKPKKADLINSELAGATVYNKLDQKNVTAWLDLRNKAAHGKYNEYNPTTS